MNKPSVSIIIPVRNSQNSIEKCIDSVLNIDYPNFELIVIDDGSTDNTAQILNKYRKNITIITNPSCLGPAKSRNLVSRQAKGEYLAFTDADCIVDKNWLKELISGFSGQGVVSVGGSQGVPKDESGFGRSVSKFMKKAGFISDYMHSGKSEIVQVSHNPSCNAIYRKDIFLKEGGFLEGLWPGEDVELDYRLRKKGYKIFFNPRAIVYHYRPQDLKSFLKMMYRYGWAQGYLVKKHGIFRRIHYVPFLSIIFFIAIIYSAVFKLLEIFILVVFLLLLYFFSFNISLLVLGLMGFSCWETGFWKGLLR